MVIAAAMKPVVSICIANYNGVPIISSCLEAVLAQLGDIPIEIIVHDDASTDDSVEYLCKNYGNINLIASNENVGFCIANNRMAAQAKGDYLLLLNNDATLFPDAIASLLAKAQEMDAPAIMGLPQYNADNGELLDMGSMLDPFMNPIPNLDPERTDVGMIMGACLWIPKNLWVELGGFPEWFGSIGEDLYLCCRARLAGYGVVALNHSGYHHWVGYSFGGGKITSNGQLRTTVYRRALTERNKTYTMILCYPPILLLMLLPVHLCLIYLEGLILAAAKLRREIFTAIYMPLTSSIWQKRRLLLSCRKTVQKNKRVSLAVWLSAFAFFPYKLRLLLKYPLPEIQ